MESNTQETQSGTGPVDEKHGSQETVEMLRDGASTVNAETMTVRQGGVQTANATHLTVRQGGLGTANTENLEMVQASAGMVKTTSAHLTASKAGAVVAGGAVHLDQSGARVLVSGGEVTMDQGGAVLMVANNVRVNNSGVVFLFARKVEGDVNTLFGQRETVLFGAIAGLVTGAVMLLGSLFRRRRGKR